MTQQQNRQLVDWLASFFQLRYEDAYAWSTSCAILQNLPGVRGCWPMSSRDENAAVYDISGQGRTLTNTGVVSFSVNKLASIAQFSGANYLSRLDEPGLECPNELTFGGWFYRTAINVEHRIMGKSSVAAAQSYHLLFLNTNVARFVIDDGLGGSETIDTVGTTLAAKWYFVAGRFDSKNKTVMLNGEIVTAAAAVVAALANTAQPFTIGETADGVNRLNGKASLCFLCGYAMTDAQLLDIYARTRPQFQSLTG